MVLAAERCVRGARMMSTCSAKRKAPYRNEKLNAVAKGFECDGAALPASHDGVAMHFERQAGNLAPCGNPNSVVAAPSA
jgi:hypothetical protein